jgi:hypothetical protein
MLSGAADSLDIPLVRRRTADADFYSNELAADTMPGCPVQVDLSNVDLFNNQLRWQKSGELEPRFSFRSRGGSFFRYTFSQYDVD